METATVILKKGQGRSLKSGGAWIYDNEIDRIRGEFSEGDMVRVEDFDGYPMGRGVHQPEFQNPYPDDEQEAGSGD